MSMNEVNVHVGGQVQLEWEITVRERGDERPWRGKREKREKERKWIYCEQLTDEAAAAAASQ